MCIGLHAKCPLFLFDLMKLEFSGQILKNTEINFHENPSSGGHADRRTDGPTDRWTDITKLIVAFRNFANTVQIKNILYLNLESPAPYCTLCSLHEPMDRNHLGQYTALSNKTECERYREARTKMMEN